MAGKRWILVFVMMALVATTSCRRLSVRVEDDEGVRVIPVPFSILRMAMRYSGEEIAFDLGELSGTETEIDLKALALALRDADDRMRIEGTDGDGMHFLARVEGKTFCVDMDNTYDEERITLNLPLAFMDLIASTEEPIPAQRLLKGFKGWRGTLVAVEGPYESIRIKVK